MENENQLEQENDEEDFQAQLNIKIKKYFETTPYIQSRDELDNFLSSIDLLDFWDSEDEKNTVWDYIFKYSNDSKIDCEGAIKGMNDLFNQDQNQGEELGEKEEEPNELATQKKERKESKETLISRLSRLSTAKGAGTKIRGNKLALNRYKQRAIEEYDCLDSNSLIQFKKIFTILNLKNSNGKITLDDLQEKCAKYKFIKTDINDIWKYLSFCVCIENVSILENKTELDINKEIVEEVDAFINQKLLNEDIDIDSDNLSEEENEDKKDNLEEITLNLVEKIMKQTIDIKENNMVLNEIKNDISALNKNDIDDYKELVNEKMKQIDEFINKNQKEVEKNINKMESVKNNTLRITDNIKVMKEDYKNLFIQYNENKQGDIDEDTERLIDENMMLSQEKESKQQEIDNLLEEKKTMKRDYQNILMQYEDAIREKNELTQEMSDLKMNNYKLKADYDKLLNDIVNKIDKEKKNKKNAKDENVNSNVNYEDQVKEIKSINNANIDDGEKISRKKDIFSNMTNEKLINYIMEVEKINQTLSNEKSTKDKKIHELTQKNVDLNNLMKKVKDRNIDLEEEAKNLQKKIDNLSNDVKNNEIFRPSIAMNSQMRVSRLSKLNTVGLNAQKFKIGNVNNKKKTEKVKLKDINTNQKIMKTPTLNKFENISMDLYGVKEVEDEEEDPENKKNGNDNKKDIELNKNNQSELNIQGKKNNDIGSGKEKNVNTKLGIGGNSNFKFGNKISSKNAFEAFNISSNKDNKGNNEFEASSSGMLFDGTNNDINLSSQQSNEINLSSGNNLNLGDITSSVINFDIKNNNNIINDNNKNNNFQTTNNNIFINEVGSNTNKNNNISQAQSNSFFEENSQNGNKDLKGKEKNAEDIPVLKIDNIMGTIIIDEDDINNKKTSKNNNEIQNENNININKEKNDNTDDERNRINTTIVKDKNNDKNQNLEKIIINGIQKEGFNIDNSLMKQSLSSTNSNNINLNGENKINANKNDSQIKINNFSNKNEIILEDSNNQININGKESNINSNKSDDDDEDDDKIDIFPFRKLSEVADDPTQIHRLSKVELDELRNNNYDYYSLFQEDFMQRKFKEQKDKCNEFNTYSDQIFLLSEKKHFNKSYIVITPSHIYLIEPKNMIFTHIIKKEDILSFQISNKNVNIIMFQIKGGDNILIETLRRMDLLSYLREFYRNNKSLIKIKYEDKFDVKIKGKLTTILVKDKIFENLSNFDGAQKIGYLFMYYGTYIFPIFKEKLFVLTSIGLIMFDEPSSPPSKLYPIIGSTVQNLEGTKYNRENVFQITLLSGKIKIFATRKRRERESWLKEFNKINKEYQVKMKQLDTINKKFMDNLGKNGA